MLLAFALGACAAEQAPPAGASIQGLELWVQSADDTVARALRVPGRGRADAEQASRLFDLAHWLEEQGRDDLALVVHRAIVDRHPEALMPSGISGTTFAEESRPRIAWLKGDRSWLATDFQQLYCGLVSALANRDPAAVAALAPPDVRVGPFRACPDGWRARGGIARELAAGRCEPGPLQRDGDDLAWFRLRVAGGGARVIVMGLSRGRAEWQAYCYEGAPPGPIAAPIPSPPARPRARP